MKIVRGLFLLLILIAMTAACSGSSSDSGNGGGGSSGGIDRSSLPDDAPAFEISPMQFPNGVSTDLDSLGIYNLTNDCDTTHYGWDFMPDWSSYPGGIVPVIAVADGIVSNVVLRNTNTYQNQDVNTYVVFLAVAKEVDIYYTFEPFITFGETEALQWLEVEEGDTVTAGDVIGYLPKLSGNLGEHLIHIDWKICTGSNRNNYVCPTNYFSEAWQQANVPILLTKIGNCPALCCE